MRSVSSRLPISHGTQARVHGKLAQTLGRLPLDGACEGGSGGLHPQHILTDAPVLLRCSDPATYQRCDVVRVFGEHALGRDLHPRQQVRIA